MTSHVSFDINKTVSVFETNIRVLWSAVMCIQQGSLYHCSNVINTHQ